MHINRQGFLTQEAPANRGAISGYSSTGTVTTARASGGNVSGDVASTSQLAALTAALKGAASATELQVEQLRLAYDSGDYPTDPISLAGNLTERLLSDLG
jgi:hypothetical protein